MINFYCAVIATVASACVLFSTENQEVNNAEVKAKTVTECLVADNVTHVEMAMMAKYFNVPGYLVVNNGNTPGLRLLSNTNSILVVGNSVFENRTKKYFGQSMITGEEIRSGLIWNMSSDELLFEIPKTGDLYTLWPGEMLFVGSYVQPDNHESEYRSGSQKACNVNCGEGYYACCNTGTVTVSCRCVKNDITIIHCESGGIGSISCSISISFNP